MARIAIDLDGVLVDFNYGFVRIIQQLYPDKVPPDYIQQSWDWHEVLSSLEYDKCFERALANPNWWMSLPAYHQNMLEFGHWLSGTKDQEIFIVTSRPDSTNPVSMSATYQSEHWLKCCGLEPKVNTLQIITVPHSEDKVDIVSRLNIDWIIDDKLETIQAMDDFPYLHAALLDQPWNQGMVKWRVKSVKDFLLLISARGRLAHPEI